jgi:hypothetical protein
MEKRNEYRLLVGKPEEKRPLDNMRKILEMGWIGLAQDRDEWRALVNVAMSLRVP